MSQSLYSAANGMKAVQNNIDTIANNISNINTTAYKKSRINISDAVYSELIDPSQPDSASNLQLGNGVIMSGQSKFFDQGFLEQTDRNLDVAIDGNGFFATMDEEGQSSYTRNGVFTVTNVNGSNYLTKINGDYVLDRNGNKIKVNIPIEQINIDSKGNMTDKGNINNIFATIGVFNFKNSQGLESEGNNSFIPTKASGFAMQEALESINIKQGYIEGSNVDLTQEMTQLMESQRAYTFLSRAISTADQMKSIENDIRR